MTIQLRLVAFLFIVTGLSCRAQSSRGRSVTGEAAARQHVQHVVRTKAATQTILLPDQATAIAVVEPILFRLYGKENIIRQRPYEAYLVDGFWYIGGTLPQGWHGGIFEVVLNAATGQVLDVTHGK